MRNRLSFVLFAALGLAGCPSPVVMGNDTGCPTAICIMDGGADTGPRPDTGGIDMGMPSCSGSGRIGAHCRGGTGAARCVMGSTCGEFPTAGTIQMAYGIAPGVLVDPAHPDYQLIDTSTMPQTAPFNAFSGGGMCLQQCDTSPGVMDTCGACAMCTTNMTQMPLIAQFGGVIGVLGATPTFGNNTGVCRLNCTFDSATRGDECPSDMTCDRFGNNCVESCTTNNECNTEYGVTYNGEVVTVVGTANTCNTTTGRCEPTGPGTASAMVGTACTSTNDCAPGRGICFAGHCAEFTCANAGMMTGGCGGTSGTAGVCLPTNGTAHPTTLCIFGCNTSTDCGPGGVCNILWQDAAHTMPFPIGGHMGYCIAQCASDDQCIPSEACTDTTTMDAMGNPVSNPGRCVPKCTHLRMVGTATGTTAPAGECLTSQWCEPDASSSASSFGQCRPLGAFCGATNTRSLPAVQMDCATAQVCDETLSTPRNSTGAIRREFAGDGHCVNPCTTTADCSAYPSGSVCITTGVLTGLCRRPCTGGTAGTDAGMECPADQTCDTALHFCVEVAPPAM